jgi:hypothetical protein
LINNYPQSDVIAKRKKQRRSHWFQSYTTMPQKKRKKVLQLKRDEGRKA